MRYRSVAERLNRAEYVEHVAEKKVIAKRIVEKHFGHRGEIHQKRAFDFLMSALDISAMRGYEEMLDFFYPN